jgi:hypothetical protein
MQAEIYRLLLQNVLRGTPSTPKTTEDNSRFVPISLPRS